MAPNAVNIQPAEAPATRPQSSIDILTSEMACLNTNEAPTPESTSSEADKAPAPAVFDASAASSVSSEKGEGFSSKTVILDAAVQPSAFPNAIQIPPVQLQTEISALELESDHMDGAFASSSATTTLIEAPASSSVPVASPEASTSTRGSPATSEPSLPKTVFLHQLPIPPYNFFTDPRRMHIQPDGSRKFGYFDPLATNDSRNHIFHSESAPHLLFDLRLSICTSTQLRFISRKSNDEVLLFCAGTALDNGSDDLGRERGGCSVVFTTKQKDDPVLFSLEDNNDAKHTSNRAELRAVFGSVRLRWWPGEGFKHVVVGTSSEYVVDNVANGNLEAWKKNDWCVVGEDGEKTPVENADFWKELWREFERWGAMGVKVSLWLLPEEWNEAKKYARVAAMANKKRFVRDLMEPRICSCERGGIDRKQHWLTEPCNKFLLAPMKSVVFRKTGMPKAGKSSDIAGKVQGASAPMDDRLH